MIKRRITDIDLRRLIIALPGGRAILRMRHYILQLLERRRLARFGDSERIFQHHYEVNEWGNSESVSGLGSTIAYTENIRKEIPRLVADRAVRSILDAPCGDYNWFRMIEWERPVSYIGGDIVRPLVERNQSRYGSSNVRFIRFDIVRDTIPTVDLWLCRDCLFHLSDRDSMLVIDKFLGSDIQYLLTTTHPACDENRDIVTGSFRMLNLLLPPFSFCEPMRIIEDWIEGYPVRHLALWERKALRDCLASNQAFQRMVMCHR